MYTSSRRLICIPFVSHPSSNRCTRCRTSSLRPMLAAIGAFASHLKLRPCRYFKRCLQMVPDSVVCVSLLPKHPRYNRAASKRIPRRFAVEAECLTLSNGCELRFSIHSMLQKRKCGNIFKFTSNAYLAVTRLMLQRNHMPIPLTYFHKYLFQIIFPKESLHPIHNIT
jgi:hypothetical protein